MTRTTLLVSLCSLYFVAGCASSKKSDAPDLKSADRAQLFDDLGQHRRTVTTSSPEAQAYFDQGLNWIYAFNHDEAIRSFAKAAELDPYCAMAWWGIGYCEGPNYNDPEMTDDRSRAAWNATRNAMARRDNTTPVERALIEALDQRYANPWPDDRTHLEVAYATAMADVWAQYPDDSDVGTLYAESLMVQHPWELYDEDGQPARADTNKAVEVLEVVLAMDPTNPGANHLYIHAIEPSVEPGQALEAADRLSNLVPDSGHLLHMPSHIYAQTGHWNRSIEQNARAMEADSAYRSLSPDQGIQHGYMTHNAHMLAFSAMMVGREEDAMAAARAMWDNVPEEAMVQIGPFFDAWMCSVYDVQKRFGRWDDLLAEPAPPPYLPTTTAVWHAHRAIAYAAKHEFEKAMREHELFRAAMNAVPKDTQWDTYETAMKFLETSDWFIAGEIALQQGDLEEAARLMEKAIAVEDTLGYGEPPLWLQPARHTLGAIYLKSGRFADAEAVYRADLAKWPGNGWSLYGLMRAQEEQGQSAEAAETRQAFEEAWKNADEPLTTSCKCIPVT